MDIQPGGVQDHFPQNVLKFGFVDWKNVDEKRKPNPIFPKIPEKLDVWMGENGKKVYTVNRGYLGHFFENFNW